MRVNDVDARALLAMVDPPPPEADGELLIRMLQAHLAAFEAIEQLDLSGVDLSANFVPRTDG